MIAALALLVALAQAKPELSPAELKGQQELTRVWTDFAKWCAEHGQKAAGQEALAAAVAAGLPEKSAGSLKKSLDDSVEKPADPALATKKSETGVAAAKVHSKLLTQALAAKSPERADAALAAEATLDPAAKSLKKDLAELVKAALDRNWNEVAGRWLAKAKSVDPDAWSGGKYKDAQLALGKKDVMLLGGGAHPLVAYVSLPASWTPAKKELPVVVAVEGAGSNFAGCCRGFREARGAREAIVVTPCSFANTNELDAKKYPWYDAATLEKCKQQGAARIGFDSAGLAEVLAELRRDFGAAEKFALTGFSGGGNLTYWWTFQHPEQLALVVGSCANFSGMGLQGAKPPADGGPPVTLLTGEKDDYNLEINGQKPGIIGQTDHAEKELARLGFKSVARRVVPGAGHSNFAAEVWKLFLP